MIREPRVFANYLSKIPMINEERERESYIEQ
jgi:hypothetical protein